MTLQVIKVLLSDTKIYIEMREDIMIRKIIKVLTLASIYKSSYKVKGDEGIIAKVANGLVIGMMPELLLQRNSHNICIKKLETEYCRIIGIVGRIANFKIWVN